MMPGSQFNPDWDDLREKKKRADSGDLSGFSVNGGGFVGALKRLGRKAVDAYDDATNRDKAGMLGRLGDEGDRASAFATRNQVGFNELGAEANQERDYLRRIARGDESVSRMQLAQALQQNQAQQQSMSAGARPGNAAMAARTAAMNSSRLGAGLAGQQAVAGIQERQAAQNALAQMLLRQREQDLNATQGARGQAINAFGTAFTGSMAQPTGFEKMLQLGKDGAVAYATMGKSEAAKKA